MKIPEPTREEKAAAGNGEWHDYIEYEAKVNRKPDWQGIGDPDPKYDLAKMMDPDYRVYLRILELREYLNG